MGQLTLSGSRVLKNSGLDRKRGRHLSEAAAIRGLTATRPPLPTPSSCGSPTLTLPMSLSISYTQLYVIYISVKIQQWPFDRIGMLLRRPISCTKSGLFIALKSTAFWHINRPLACTKNRRFIALKSAAFWQKGWPLACTTSGHILEQNAAACLP